LPFICYNVYLSATLSAKLIYFKKLLISCNRSAIKSVPTKNSSTEQQVSLKEAKEIEAEAPIMAVHGIYYKCPLIGNFFNMLKLKCA
jgi:hypothetical protein